MKKHMSKKTLYPENPVLIVDDEPQALKSYEYAFKTEGINNIIACNDSREVKEILKSHDIEIIILDIIMPYVSGEELLESISRESPEIPVIMITGVNQVEAAVNCMHKGAADYLVKPVSGTRLINTIKKNLQIRELQRENIRLQEQLLSTKAEHPEAFSGIITTNRQMQTIFQYCEAVAKSRQPVLITGETGAGKELFARAIHNLSGCKGNFIAVNISGYDDNMLSDTLFGHKKGAFTGATDNRDGLIEKAGQGTLFLDEIGDLNPASQIKLLRLLQEREYTPLGSDITKRTNTRVLLATHQNLHKLQSDNTFRKDLYYRIATHHVHIPPLRERKDDLKELLDYFLKLAAQEMHKKIPSYHPELITLLKSYFFPGNVRELRSMVFDAVSNHKNRMLSMKTFQRHIEKHSPVSEMEAQTISDVNWISKLETLPTLKDISGILVDEAISRADGNQSVAAKILGISPQALSARLKKRSQQ